MKKNEFQDYLILVPRQEDSSRVKEHLRYWPYVKAFCGTEVIWVRVLIGRTHDQKEWERYVNRSGELIALCLRQYEVQVAILREEFCNTPIGYTPSLFLRPDQMLKDFRSFIDEGKLWKKSNNTKN